MTSMRSKAVSWILILAMVFTTVFGNAAMVFADTPEPSESTYAAMIGETGYEDLQEAIDAADGKTVTLEKDVTVTEGIHVPAGTTMTLDLNGFTVSQEKACTEHYVMITNNGNLTITGEGAISFKDTGAGDPKHGWGSYTVGNYGTLIVENGTIEHLGEQEFAKHMICAIQQFDGTVTINDGTISTPNYRSVRVNKGNLILNGGEFDGQVWIQPNQGDATITVTGGTFGPNDGDGSSIFMTNVGEKYTVTSAEISGGTFTTKIGCSNPDALAGSITGGTFSQSAMDYTNSVLLAEGKTFVDGKLQDAELPNAEVINLGKKHVDSKDFVDGYIIYNLMNQSIVDFDAVDPFDLQIAMQFLAKDSVEQAAANYYGQYITDFYLTFDGMKEDSFVADGCYLAGYYPSFGAWVKIPMDGFRVENGTVYPVITGAGFEFTYEMICDGVKDFTCGLFLSDEVLKANPDLKVKLELGLSKDVNAALNGVYKTVDKPYVYTVEDMKGSVIADSTVIDSIADKNTGVDRGDVADIVEDIANNVALKDYTPDNLQNANTIDIVLVDMDVNVADGEEATPTKITYDVTPKDENGTAIENFDNKVTFRLPVPSSVAENQAKVYHKGDLMGIYTIQGSDNAKYVEVSSANFSEYTVEPVSNVKIVAAVGGVGFDSFADALDAAEVGDTVKVMTDIEPTTSIKIATDKNITLDLNGHVIAGTDTATGSFGLINVDPGAVLTVTDSSESKDGKITLTAKNDRDWNAYSSVISNQRGKVVVEGGTIEHLGGTDMAYGIDNLTNGKGTYAETIINGGTVKSTYRAIRQFLNGVEAQNILTINGGTIEGANKSVWMQDSSANANSGTLTIGEEATLKGDVYLFVTAGSTEWPVTVTIAKEALDEDSKVSTGNVPAGYELKETENGFGVVETFEAMIDDDKYPTLKDAFDAVEDGDTVKLLTDVSIDTETYTIKDGVSVTLDMNGKKLTVTDNKETVNYELFYVYGEMTVTGNGAIELTAMHDRDWNAMSAIFHNRGGVLNIENGTFKHLGGSDMAYVVDNSGNYYGDATTNINDGTLDSTYIAIRNRMEQNSHGASGKAILNVYGGTITGPRRAIWAQAASTSTTSPATGEINITGGEIGLIETDCSAGAESMTTISGGTVDAVKCEVGELAVTGGTVGTVTTLTTSGEEVEYTVTDEGQYVTAIAKIGDVKYASLQEAIDAAEDGDTIVLLNDVTEDVTVTQSPDVKITIDGNGKTMNGAITVDGKSKGYETAGVTIKNVNFDATGISTDACINLGVSGNTNTRYTNNVTVEDCTFKGAGQAKVAIKSYTGGDRNFTATGCTVESTMHSFLQLKGVDGVMIDECTVNSKNGINLNNSENAVIQNSKVEVSGYAVRMGESTGGGSGKVELTNNVLKTDNTEDPVIEIRGEAATELDLTMSENVVSGNTHFKGTTDATKIDANANYWGENLSAPVVADGSTAVKVVNYYEDEALTKLIVSDLAGEGTEANPYLINTLDELKWFRDDVNAGNTYSKKFVKLGADIDLGSEEWTPIGIQGKAFNGVFDGNNKKISNLMITGYNSEVGLFGRTNTGEIKNLTIENAKVSGRLKVGVVAGTPYTSKYTNIK